MKTLQFQNKLGPGSWSRLSIKPESVHTDPLNTRDRWSKTKKSPFLPTDTKTQRRNDLLVHLFVEVDPLGGNLLHGHLTGQRQPDAEHSGSQHQHAPPGKPWGKLAYFIGTRYQAVCRIWLRDPVLFLTHESGIRIRDGKSPDPGMNIPNHISESLALIF